MRDALPTPESAPDPSAPLSPSPEVLPQPRPGTPPEGRWQPIIDAAPVDAPGSAQGSPRTAEGRASPARSPAPPAAGSAAPATGSPRSQPPAAPGPASTAPASPAPAEGRPSPAPCSGPASPAAAASRARTPAAAEPARSPRAASPSAAPPELPAASAAPPAEPRRLSSPSQPSAPPAPHPVSVTTTVKITPDRRLGVQQVPNPCRGRRATMVIFAGCAVFLVLPVISGPGQSPSCSHRGCNSRPPAPPLAAAAVTAAAAEAAAAGTKAAPPPPTPAAAPPPAPSPARALAAVVQLLAPLPPLSPAAQRYLRLPVAPFGAPPPPAPTPPPPLPQAAPQSPAAPPPAARPQRPAPPPAPIAAVPAPAAQAAPAALPPAAAPSPPAGAKPDWVVLLTVNMGYYDFFLNWLAWYRKLKLRYSVRVVAEDADALTALRRDSHPEVTVVNYTGTFAKKAATAHSYDTGGFKDLVSKRGGHLAAVLREGKAVIYTDTDTVWLGDPVQWCKGDFDMWMQMDTERYNNQSPYYCTGLIAALPTKRALAAIEEWERRLRLRPQANQPVFNDVVHSVQQRAAGLRHTALPRAQFPSGMLYFDKRHELHKQPMNYDRSSAVVVHNNYIQGHAGKLARWKAHKLWLLADNAAEP